MSAVEVSQGRPRRWWLAFLLNLFLPPAGYAYAGRWRAVVILVTVVFALVMVAMEWSLAHPPGIYEYATSRIVHYGPGATALGWGIAILLGAHAAWLARRSPLKQGSRLLHTVAYVSPIVLLFAVAVGIRALWPQSAYSMVSSSMAPTFAEDDVIAVRGARALCGHTRPQPGEVAVYKREGSPVAYMHRVVAGPGQTVALKNGQLSVDGRPVVQRLVGKGPSVWEGGPAATVVEETLVNGARYRTLDYGPSGPLDTIAAVTLPANRWYFLGDSRDNSADSRMYGPVAARNICGVAVLILDSKDKRRVGQKP